MASCAGGRPAVLGPLEAPGGVERSLVQGTQVRGPARVDFAWELNERGARMDGVGVARLDAPYRARLDLFLNNGEGVVSAAVVEDELRLPPGGDRDLLPPIDLLWGVVGVFRPVPGTSLSGAERLEGGLSRLRYRDAEGIEVHYEVEGETLRVIEVIDRESVVEWLRLSADRLHGYPREVVYRNLADFRELKMTVRSVRAAEPFDPAIWDPRGR
jgi:hypothetical protein